MSTPSRSIAETEETPIVAYQLSLLGDAPKPCRAWRRPYYVWTIFGLAVPLSEAEERQCRMLRPSQNRQGPAEHAGAALCWLALGCLAGIPLGGGIFGL